MNDFEVIHFEFNTKVKLKDKNGNGQESTKYGNHEAGSNSGQL